MNIEFDVATQDNECHLRAGDFTARDEFRSEVIGFLQVMEPKECLVLSLLPPFKGRFAAKGAFETARDVIEENAPNHPVRMLVATKRVAEELSRLADTSQRQPLEFDLGAITCRLVHGSIIDVECDAIVNALNTRLQLGAGVAGAIRRNARPALQQELSNIAATSDIMPGDVVVTGAYGLPNTRRILHAATVAGKKDVLARAMKTCLELTEEKHIQSLTVPALGTGVGGCPIEECADVLVGTAADYAEAKEDPVLKELIFVLWTPADFDAFAEIVMSLQDA